MLHGLLNTFGVDLVKLLSDVSAWWHLAGVAVIVAILAIVPDHHYPIAKVFTANRQQHRSARHRRRRSTRSSSVC